MQVDPVFEGLEGGPGTLIKYNPLSNVSSPEVWNFLRAMVMPSSYHSAQMQLCCSSLPSQIQRRACEVIGVDCGARLVVRKPAI